MGELMEGERLLVPCGCPSGRLAAAYSLPRTIRWMAGRNILLGLEAKCIFIRLPILSLSSSRSPPAAAGREEQPLPDQGSLWPADAAAPEQRLPAPLPPPAVRAQPRAHADRVSAAGMELGQSPRHRGRTRRRPPTPPPSIPTIPGSAPWSSFAPRLLCGPGWSLPRGRERWLGGFFVSIFGNPGRAVPHPQAFGIRDGKFHL